MAVNVESLKRNIFPFVTGVAVGAGLSFLENKYPGRKLQTNPNLPVGIKIADEALELTVMRFIKVWSHKWHWEDSSYDKKFDEFGVRLNGAPSGNPHNNPFFGVIAHLGGRPWGHIIEGQRTASQVMSKEGYFIGFRHPNSNQIRRCNIELLEPVMLLSGPDNGCIAYAMDKEGDPIRLNLLSALIHRKDKPKEIRIL